MAGSFGKLGRLGACFCFNRGTAGLNSDSHLFRNLCYQFAHFEEHGQFPIKNAILSAIRSIGYVVSSSLHTQARKLIVDTVNTTQLIRTVVILIHGLDESGTVYTRKGLLDAIAAAFPKLPQSIKVLVISRDEHDLRNSLQTCSKELYIGIDDAENTPEDNARYIEHRLMETRRRSHLNQHWPSCLAT